MTKSVKATIAVLLLLCVIIAAFPLLSIKDSEFGGADGAAEAAILAIDPAYQPWAERSLEPPGILMILLDKLAYSSPIRQKSPALKTLFAAGSLTICVSFRHSLVCLLILCCMAVCTLRFANLSAKRYLRFLTGPFLFLMLSSVAILFFFSSSPQDLISIPCFSGYLGISHTSFSHWYQLKIVSFSSIS